jgi:hypothetical protein
VPIFRSTVLRCASRPKRSTLRRINVGRRASRGSEAPAAPDSGLRRRKRVGAPPEGSLLHRANLLNCARLLYGTGLRHRARLRGHGFFVRRIGGRHENDQNTD